ncbi:restriction endonuclease subunit S [Lyngbya sp. PCC 8106]|uniref:restriction endonuclease subunit S n=1 Tax=Lyngbya sp. (strain PCC 8106) TaxID=313612 RepID=UPI0000EA9056|nr:restriction endonuclease subunit S [Lyngbya sp. PCC 8106]EAW34512.1 hypothetical protein L8106_03529 [Lyngbya sp. PCC 8106]
MKKYKSYSTDKPSGVEWLGNIPEHWELRKLKFIADLIMGQSPDSTDYNYEEIGVPFLQGTAEFGIINPNPRLSCESAKKYARKDDLLLSVRAPVGEINVADQVYGIGRGLCAIRPKINVFNKTFTRYFLEIGKVELVSGATGSIYDAVTVNQVANLQCLTPPLKEQKLIATFLDRETTRIDTLITKKCELINLLEKKRTAIITNAVTKGLEPELPMKDSGVEWLGKVPRNWEVKKLKYIAQIVRGKFTHRPRNDPRFYDGNYPFIQTGDISAANKYITSYQQTLNELGLSVSKEFPKGTLVMTIAANIGDLAILDFPACFPDSIVGFLPRNYCLDFLYYNLTAMKSEMVKTATLNTQMNLNIERIGGLFSICPPIAIQKQIATYLDKVNIRIDELIDKTATSISELTKYRQSLITAAVTGKIDVREEVERGAA